MKKCVFVLVLLLFSACAGKQAEDKKNQNEFLSPYEESHFNKRKRMVYEQLVMRDISDTRILRALGEIERHLFVPDKYKPFAYSDGPVPIGEGQTISQPYIVALMTQLLHIKPDDRVLEIGTGSGYQASVLAELAKEVYTIEIIPTLGERAKALLSKLGYKNIHVRIGDGYKGWPEAQPFDCIIVTAAPPYIPQPLLNQLRIGGRMVIPVGSHNQELILVTKTKNGITEKEILPVSFVPMTGQIQQNW